MSEVLIGVIWCLLFSAFIVGWKVFDNLKELYSRNNIFQKVGWIAERCNNAFVYKDSVALRDKELVSYIIQEQNNMKIPKDYHLDYSNETEKINVDEILELHKNDVIKSYFHDFIKRDKVFCNLNSLEYYMFSLTCFLQQKLKGNDKIYTKREYTDESNYYRMLTDYGIAYYKLYLITTMFCRGNDKIKMLVGGINTNVIMEHLKNNKVEFWSY